MPAALQREDGSGGIALARLALRCVTFWLAIAVSPAAGGPRQYQPDGGTSAPIASCFDRYGGAEQGRKVRLAELLERADQGIGSFGVDANTRIVHSGGPVGEYLAVSYPAGSTAPSQKGPLGGAGFYNTDIVRPGSNAVCLRYRLRFPEGFDFVHGGKLPGLFGGSEPPSGGARPKGDDGFTVRLMWREYGQGEVYLYAPNMEPSSQDGGMSLTGANWRFKTGVWQVIDLEVLLNRPGGSDGRIHLWVDGNPVVMVRGVRYRKSGDVSVSGLMFSTFFGGKSSRFAPKAPQEAHFVDFQALSAHLEALDG